MADDDDTKWHLDKKVPLALIGAVVGQTFLFGWYAATQSAHTETNTMRIDSVEKNILALTPRFEAVIRLEAKLDALQSSVLDLKTAMTARNAAETQQDRNDRQRR